MLLVPVASVTAFPDWDATWRERLLHPAGSSSEHVAAKVMLGRATSRSSGADTVTTGTRSKFATSERFALTVRLNARLWETTVPPWVQFSNSYAGRAGNAS